MTRPFFSLLAVMLTPTMNSPITSSRLLLEPLHKGSKIQTFRRDSGSVGEGRFKFHASLSSHRYPVPERLDLMAISKILNAPDDPGRDHPGEFPIKSDPETAGRNLKRQNGHQPTRNPLRNLK